MYWRIGSFPELQYLTEKQRARLIRERCGLLFYVKLVGFSAAIALATSILLFIGYGIADQLLFGGVLAIGAWSTVVFLFLLYLGLVVFWYGYFMTRIRGQLRLFLEEQRAKGDALPICLNCGYAVTAGQQRCPECGARLTAI